MFKIQLIPRFIKNVQQCPGIFYVDVAPLTLFPHLNIAATCYFISTRSTCQEISYD